ncbi:MAG: sensor domain-containing diguanylate cyclase [bacterium]
MKIWNRQEDEVRLDPVAPQALGRLVPGRRKLRPSRESVLHAGEPLYRAIFDEAPIGLYITTANGTIVNANAELARMLGYPSKQTLLGTNVAEIYADPHDRDRAIDALGRLGAAHRSEVELHTRSGAIIQALDTCCVVRDENGTALYYQGCLRDVTEARRLEEQLRKMARHDPLTGVYNRHALAEILVAEAARSRRYGHPIGMLMVDVDRFKEFNDRFGHEAGDEILKGVAGLITRCVRDSDVVVRYGGDEFLVLLVETDGQAVRVKDRIECAMAVEFGDSRYGAPVTVSIGAVHWSSESGESISTLLGRADKAMYAEKTARLPA